MISIARPHQRTRKWESGECNLESPIPAKKRPRSLPGPPLVVARCASCGFILQPDDDFCADCGERRPAVEPQDFGHAEQGEASAVGLDAEVRTPDEDPEDSEDHPEDPAVPGISWKLLEDPKAPADPGSQASPGSVVKLTFQPGSIGIQDADGIITTIYSRGQAALEGAKVGWKIIAVNGELCTSFTSDIYQKAKSGDKPYEVTFATVPLQPAGAPPSFAHQLRKQMQQTEGQAGKACWFGKTCKSVDCPYIHAEGRDIMDNPGSLVCRYGRQCTRSDCFFVHPAGRDLDDTESLVCRYGRQCLRSDCFYVHPAGRDLDEALLPMLVAATQLLPMLAATQAPASTWCTHRQDQRAAQASSTLQPKKGKERGERRTKTKEKVRLAAVTPKTLVVTCVCGTIFDKPDDKFCRNCGKCRPNPQEQQEKVKSDGSDVREYLLKVAKAQGKSKDTEARRRKEAEDAEARRRKEAEELERTALRDKWFYALPGDDYTEAEAGLREALLAFIDHWHAENDAPPTLSNAKGDEGIRDARAACLPNYVSLTDWMENRAGGEIEQVTSDCNSLTFFGLRGQIDQAAMQRVVDSLKASKRSMKVPFPPPTQGSQAAWSQPIEYAEGNFWDRIREVLGRDENEQDVIKTCKGFEMKMDDITEFSEEDLQRLFPISMKLQENGVGDEAFPGTSNRRKRKRRFKSAGGYSVRIPIGSKAHAQAIVGTQPGESDDVDHTFQSTSNVEGNSTQGQDCTIALGVGKVGQLAEKLQERTKCLLDDRAMRALQGLSTSDAVEVLQNVDDMVQAQGGHCHNLAALIQSKCRKVQRRFAKQGARIAEIDGPTSTAASWNYADDGAESGAKGVKQDEIVTVGADVRAPGAASELGSKTSNCSNNGKEEFSEQTTVILKNLPFKYRRDDLIQLLDDEGFSDEYDFVYLPVDLQKQQSHGYAVVNMVSYWSALSILEHFEGFDRWNSPSDCVCEIGWNEKLQGLAAHIEKYRNSPVMHKSVPDAYRPAVFARGVRTKFAAPTSQIPAPLFRI